MGSVRPAEKVQQVVESFCAANAASEDVFLCYKFGRYQDIFPEKPYFLLSHCAHILFSLWRIEEESKDELFPGNRRPTAFLAGLDFDGLRYTDYKRRILHADSMEEHWRNETQWFELWMRVLEHLDSTGTNAYQEFARPILAHMTQGDVLEDKSLDKTRKAFGQFMRTDAVGRVMLRTLTVLDELMRGIVHCVAWLDPKTHLLDQVTLIAGLLKGIRRTVVYQTPARGPYVPRSATSWRAPSRLPRLFWGGTQGFLTVIPHREGGEVICIYNPTSGSNDRQRSWTRSASSLAGTYEQELFATWSPKTGEYREDPGRFSDVTACWTLQNEEAGRIESMAQQIEGLLDAIRRQSMCERMIEDVKSFSRRDNSRWKSTELPWSYVHQLDRLLTRLAFVRREAKAIGAPEVAGEVIARLWPPRKATACQTDSAQDDYRGEADPSEEAISKEAIGS